jgi:hypothetical protein
LHFSALSSKRPFGGRALCLLAVLAASATGSISSAQPPPATPSAAELSAARQLFTDALKAEDEGRWAAALALYERIAKITTSPNLLFHLAVCHEKLGNPVEALNAFEIARREADRKGVAEVVSQADTHIKALRKTIGSVVLELPRDATGIRITIDGRPINAALAGTSMLVAPGVRRLQVSADNYEKVLDVTLQVQEGASRTIQVDLGPRRAAPQLPVVVAPPAGTAPPPGPPVAPPPRSHAPLIVVSGATAALALGAVITGVAANAKHAAYITANDDPTPGSLDARQSLRDQGQALALTSTILTAGALLSAGFGVYLLLGDRTPPAKPPQSAGPPVALWVGPSGGGLVVRGAL